MQPSVLLLHKLLVYKSNHFDEVSSGLGLCVDRVGDKLSA